MTQQPKMNSLRGSLFGSKIFSFSVRDKIDSLLFLTHLDPGIQSAYQLNRSKIISNRRRRVHHDSNSCHSRHMIKRRTGSVRPRNNSTQDSAIKLICDISDQDKNNDNKDTSGRIFIPQAGTKMKLYRSSTNLIHCLNAVKFIIIFLTFDIKLIPIESNCYILGRMSVHEQLINHLPVLAISIELMIIVWRYLVLSPAAGFEIDSIIYILQNEDVIDEEMISSSNKNLSGLFPENILQRILFYRSESGKQIDYRLRPNRTKLAMKKLHNFSNHLAIALFVIYLITSVGILPYSFSTATYDITFIRNYPTCCPIIEQMAHDGQLDLKQISWTGENCSFKQLTLPFDFIDNITSFIDGSICLFIPVGISMLITYDLEIYWRFIDKKVNNLVSRLKLREVLYTDMKEPVVRCNYEHSGSRILLSTSGLVNDQMTDPSFTVSDDREEKRMTASDGRRYNESYSIGRYYRPDSCSYYVDELQSLLCDFFDCFGRANRFVGILLTFTIGVFTLSISLFAYFTWNLESVWDVQVLKLLLALVYLMFLMSALLTLRLKSIIDKTYVALCSAMAYDRSESKLKWTLILECYTFKAGNTFFLFNNVRFTWMFVLNLFATSVSFLIAIATFKMHA